MSSSRPGTPASGSGFRRDRHERGCFSYSCHQRRADVSKEDCKGDSDPVWGELVRAGAPNVGSEQARTGLGGTWMTTVLSLVSASRGGSH